MGKVGKALSRLGGFAATALLSGAINVATIPIVVMTIGASAWGSIAAGQAVGVIGSIFVQLGWGVTGPTQIAATKDESKRVRIYLESLVFRIATIPLVLAVVIAVAWHIVPREFSAAASVAAAGASLLGLTASWYFVGKGDPSSLFRLDTVPRVLAMALGSALLFACAEAILFSCAILLGSLVPFLCASTSIKRSSKPVPIRTLIPTMTRIKEVAAHQSAGVLSSVLSQTYKQLPLILISASRPQYAPAYALIDRLLKFAIAGIKPVSQVMQSWVPATNIDQIHKRVNKAMIVAGFAGMVSALAFMAIGPLVTPFLGGRAISVSWSYYLPAAITLALSALTQTGLLCLLALRRVGAVAWSVGAAGTVGMLLLWPALELYGNLGGLYCLTLAELTMLLFQVFVIGRSARASTRARSLQRGNVLGTHR